MDTIFKDRLKGLLKIRNISQKELSVATGIGEALISHYIKGNKTPHCKNLIRIAKALDTTTDFLLGLSSIQNSMDFYEEKEYRKAISMVANEGYFCFKCKSFTTDKYHCKNCGNKWSKE